MNSRKSSVNNIALFLMGLLSEWYFKHAIY